MRRRGLPGPSLRGPRLQRRRARAEGLQRRGAAFQTPLRRGPPAARRRPRRRPGALSRSGDLGPFGRAPSHQYLPAERQSVRNREVRLQAGMDDAAQGPHQVAPRQRGEDGHRRRLQRDPGAGGRVQSQHLDGRRPVQARDARPFPGAPQSRPNLRVPRLPRRAAPLHLLGLSGRRLPEEPGLAYRPSAPVAASRRPAPSMRDRSRPKELGEALRPRADLYRACCLGFEPGSVEVPPKPTDSPIDAGGGAPFWLKGAASDAAEAVEAAASGASSEAGIIMISAGFALAAGATAAALTPPSSGNSASASLRVALSDLPN